MSEEEIKKEVLKAISNYMLKEEEILLEVKVKKLLLNGPECHGMKMGNSP